METEKKNRGCTEQANKKRVATKIFYGSGRHKYIKKSSKQGGIETPATSLSYNCPIDNRRLQFSKLCYFPNVKV
jgi:hypothetical protein